MPGNYPFWLRTNKLLWWTLCIFPTQILEETSIEEILQPILEDMKAKKGIQIYDIFRKEHFPFNAVIAAVVGDLNGRSFITGFVNSTLFFYFI